MKRILFFGASVLALTSALAQTSFLEKTCYRGAFAPAPTPMWTDGWTEWDPLNKVYPAPNMTVTGNITSSTTWSTGQVVLLSAQCFVKGNSVLTIQPGVIILGDKSVTGAGLFITKGSQLIANGTVTAPIVFTSNQAPGQRSLGDWGGVILMGKASNNNPNGLNNIEGLPVSADTEYGGGTSPDDNDNSGSLKYVRIEWGGYIYQPNKEINGLTFGAVGRGTTIDHVQVSFSNDDAYEWFGGAVQCKHLVAYRCLDDNFDTDNGFHGIVQFGLGVRDANIADNPSVSTSEGFESDNDPNGTTATPITNAIFSNITDIGPLRGVSTATCASGFRRGARIRRNSALRIVNSILMDHKTNGVFIDGTLSENNAAGTTSNQLLFAHNVVANYGQRATESQTTSTAFNATINAWVKSANDTLPFIGGTGSNSILVTAYNYTAPDYRPHPASIALTGASFTDAVISSAVITTGTGTVTSSVSNSSVCIGNNSASFAPVTFSATSSTNAEYCSMFWTAQSGVALSSSTSANPTFTVSTVGTFTLMVSVTDGYGTHTSISSLTTYTCLDVSVRENASIEAGMYPNPSKDFAVVQVHGNVGAISINVFDITGKNVVVPTTSVEPGNYRINTENLNSGLYFVTIEAANGKETVKLIVQK